MSPHIRESSAKKYKVCLSSTFRDFPNLHSALLRQLIHARLFYFSAGLLQANYLSLEAKLKSEIGGSSIIVILAKESLDSAAALFELEYARSMGKPILIYFTETGSYDSFTPDTKDFKAILMEEVRYGHLQGDDYEATGDIIGDILNAIVTEPNLTTWVRSDLSQTEVESVAMQRDEFDKRVLLAGSLIQQHETLLTPDDRDRLVGPLIDLGIRQNVTGQAYCFAVGCTPQHELLRSDLAYDYCIDRFTRFESGIVYDRKLNLSWRLLEDMNLTWRGAMRWHDYISEDTLSLLLEVESSGKNENANVRWRLPKIEELMTIITHTRGRNAFIDEVAFPEKVHWLWSSSLTEDKQHAYYIETTESQVLKDSISEEGDAHYKGVIVCTEGRIRNIGKPIRSVTLSTISEEAKRIRTANQSRRIQGVYLFSLSRRLHDREYWTALHNALSNAGYYLSNYAELRSRTGANKEVIRRELESNDYLVLIIEHSALTQSGESDLEIARSAISIARQIGVPVILYHNLDSQSLLYLSKSLSFSLDQIGVVRCFRDFKDLSFEILTSLADHQKFFPSPGWMQQQDFEAINKSIENINSTIEELEAGKDRLEAFIDHCGEHNLRSAFENCEVLPKPPEFGERNWFASYENPIHRFSSETGNLPVLYIRVPNRFKPLLRQDEYVVVYDRYLGLKWWTLAKKNTSYVEALAYAQEISSREKENWRLPTVNEMITLMTRTRGTRKYMDEKVFPLGRWFWTSTREDDEIFYVDFNYLNSAVDKEQASPSGDVPAIRKKSVILVTSDTLVTPNDITENKRFAAEQMTIRAKKKSVGVDNLVSILFLAADPTDASRLRLGEELREIQEKLQLSKLRDRFALHQRMSVRPADISQALLDVQPQIVHFSGHGISMGALCFENQMGETHPIRPEALAALFEMFTNQVNCVLLNACYSEIQAEAIAKHIDYVIGMNRAIGDKAAIAFAIGFYQALGAGRTIEEAYKLGCVQIGLQDIPEHLTPVLIKKGQVHP